VRAIESREIDGLTFQVQQLPGRRGSRLSARLMRMLLPAAAEAVGGGGKLPTGLADLDLSGLGKAAQTLFERLTVEEFESIREELMEGAMVTMENGNTVALKPVFDDVMAGRAFTTLKLMQFALEVNFKDFFGGVLAAAVAAGKAALQSKLQTQTTGPVSD
jgi:hypothetical protein